MEIVEKQWKFKKKNSFEFEIYTAQDHEYELYKIYFGQGEPTYSHIKGVRWIGNGLLKDLPEEILKIFRL